MKLIAQKEAAEFVKTGAKEFRYNRDSRLTPGAKDVFTEAGIKMVFDSNSTSPKPDAASPRGSNASGSDDAALFNSKQAREAREQICEIGRRIWIREYCDGNGGNIS